MDSLFLYSSARNTVTDTLRGASHHVVPGSLEDTCTSMLKPAESSLYHSATAVQNTPVLDRQVSTPAPDQHPAADVDPALTGALATQQGMIDQLGETTAAEKILELPHHSILVAQFATDPEGTCRLLAARIKALKADIEQTFSRFGHKQEAEALLKQLEAKLANLEQNMDETALISVIQGIQDYERTFEKDSWIQLVNIAFVGITAVMSSIAAGQFRNLLDPARLALGESNLLDPSIVSKYNVGRFSSNPDGLANAMAAALSHTSDQTLDKRQHATVNTLNFQDLPAFETALNPIALMEHLAKVRPDVVFKLMFNEFESDSHNPDHDFQQNGQSLLNSLQTAGQCPEAMISLMNQTEGMTEYLGTQIQHHILQQTGQDLFNQTNTIIENSSQLTEDDVSSLRETLQFSQQLAKQLKSQKVQEELNNIAAQFELFDAIPLHQVITSGQYQGETLWHLDHSLSLAQVASAIKGSSDQPCQALVQQLKAFIEHPKGNDLESFRKHQIKKDELMTAQQDFVLAQAEQALGNEDAFFTALETARHIEASRPPYQLICNNSTMLERVLRAGRTAITPDRLPLQQRTQSLMLEHNMIVRGYDFKAELLNLFQDMPGLFTNMTDAAGKACTSFAELKRAYMAGDISTATLIGQLVMVSNDAKNGFVQQFRDALTGAAVIGKASPQTLRALYGNTAQTANNIYHAVGQTSPLWALYSELHSRVGAETNAQHFIEAMDRNGGAPNLDELTPEEMNAVKRLLTITKLLSKGMYAPQAIDGLIKTVAGGANPLNIIWNVTCTGVKMLTTYMVANKVNSMRPDDLKVLNATLDVLRDGPAVAAYRQQAMERSGRILADIACKKCDVETIANATVLYPFKVLLAGFQEAIQEWKQGKPGSLVKVGWMCIKVAPTVIAPIATLAGLVTMPVLSIGFATCALVGLPGAVYMSWSWANYMASNSGLIDIATLALSRARELTQDNSIDFDGIAEQLLTETRHRERTRDMAENHSYDAIATKHWANWASQNRELAEQTDQQFKSQLALDWQRNEQKLQRLSQITSTLNYLTATDISKVSDEELRAHLPDYEQEAMPAEDAAHHREFWAMGLEERLRDELFRELGTYELPKNEQQLRKQLHTFAMNRMRGMMIVAEFAEARDEFAECIEQTAAKIHQQVHQRMALVLADALQKSLQKTFESRALVSANQVEGKMRSDIFLATLQQDKGLQDAITKHFHDVYTAEILKASQYSHKRLKDQLAANGQHLSDEDVQGLAAAAAAS